MLPSYTKQELIDFMDAFDRTDLPDGAWFHMLEEGGEAFIKEYKVNGKDGNDIAHEYIKARHE